ncbi:MAG TPA: DEAD/DEAH box helicase, partial [Kofleriaceae bacterium]|nr:DEAD/DEAH box helicase [Kofleriaceae bacterium]
QAVTRMAFASLLTHTRLRALAGYSYERGERYWREGRVQAYAPQGDGVSGVVVGTSEYAVRVFAHGRTIAADCTCPVAGRDLFCKHAVALSLQYLEAPRDEDTKPQRACFATRGELDDWCTEHQVTHELAIAADMLVEQITYSHPNLAMVLRNLSLRDVGSLDGTGRYVGIRALQRPIAEAAAHWLERAAADVRVALGEEKRLRAVPSAEPLAGFVTSLLGLRAQLRRKVAPRSRAMRSTGALDLDAKAGALVWREPTRISLRKQLWTTLTVSTRLVFSPSPQLTCTCTLDRCVHALALVDAALDLLDDPADGARASLIAEELMRPPWQRALAELAAVDDAPATTRVEVWWQLEHQFGNRGIATLSPLVKKQLKKGGVGVGTRITPQRLLDEHAAQLDEQDTRIAEALVGWVASRASTYPARAFTALVGHPRVVHEDEPDVLIAVKRLPLGFAATATGEHIKLEPTVDGARFSPRLLAPLLDAFAPSEPLVVIEHEHARCLLIEVGDDARRLWAVLARHGDAFPPESHGALLEQLSRLEPRLPIDVPHTLKGAQLAANTTTVLRMRLVRGATLEIEVFVRPAPGAPLFPPNAGPRDVMVQRDGARGYVRRQLGEEHAQVREALARLPLESAVEGPPLCFTIDDVDAALTLVAAVQTPPPGVEAEWIDARPTILSSGGPPQLRVHIDTKRDWFGINGELVVEQGRLELAVLLDAMRRQQRFVRLDEERWVELSDALREHLTSIADRTFAVRNQTELSPAAVPAVRALIEAGAQVDVAPAWQQLTERLAASTKLRPRPPTSLATTLRPYQIEGHAWLSRLAAWGAGGCLADDMGLGKTIQAIAVMIDRAKLGPALVLAPTSVTLNWIDELRRFGPTLRPVIYGEQADRAGCIAKLGKKDVLIVSYGLLVRDAAHLASRSFATLVVDEAQALKNPTTHRAKAARTLVADFRIALTGTPLENHLGELWSLFSIVFPNLLGSWEQFRTRFAVPIERSHSADARAALSRLIKPFLLRRTKQEVARELPPRTEIHVPVALSSEETALYEDARLAAVAHLTRATKQTREERRRFDVLAALTRLRLLASHPKLYDSASTVASSKLQRLLELVEELREEGHRALVFSQFVSHLELVREELDAAGISSLYLDGSTPAATRKQLIDRFQTGEGDVFLISLKAGGTGINLTAADYVIHLDPWWNPAVEDQASDRAHRIGQTKPVTVYRLISRGTVEERILAMHRDKRALVSSVLDGTGAAARLTMRDLLALVTDRAEAHTA